MSKAVVAIIVIGILSAVLLTLAVILLTGHGTGLIAGYNTLPDEEKATFDAPALAKFLGKILLPIALTCPCIAIGAIYGLTWLNILFVAETIGLIVFAAIYCNTGNRFRK
ncbi:MAG: DUF3784 domain-containing protein [Clostridia bacterium]|nr:DUF3784 domain-containing protein [Clostridia bacterium]